MTAIRTLLAGVAIAALACPAIALAEAPTAPESASVPVSAAPRVGFMLKPLYGTGWQSAPLVGVEGRAVSDMGSYIGGAGYGTTSGINALNYGGVILGQAGSIGATPLTYDAQLLLGGGSISGSNSAGLAVEPQLRVGWRISRFVVALTGGYLYAPGLSNATGPTSGLDLGF